MRSAKPTSYIQTEFGHFVGAVFDRVHELVELAPEDLQPVLSYHLAGMTGSKGFRPALVMASAQAHQSSLSMGELVTRGAIVQLFHEMTIMVDDVLDQSRYRRGRLAVHCRFGRVPAVCAALWAKEIGTWLKTDAPIQIEQLTTCAFSLMDGEAHQWKLRGPLDLLRLRVGNG